MSTGTAGLPPVDSLRERVLRPRAALRRGEAAAFRRDRAALDAVRGRDLDLDLAVAAGDLVHLRWAHAHPHLAQVARDAALEAQVVRLVVARPVPREVDRRELVEGELPVRPRIAARTAGADELDLRVGLGAQVGGRELAAARGHRASERGAEPEAAAEGLAHVPDGLEVAPDEALPQGIVVDGQGSGGRGRLARLERRERRFGSEPAGLDCVVD